MSCNLPVIKTCNSLVFFDLETTGIPAFHSPKITELSFCAVERNQFLHGQPKQVPRVTNRLNLCIYPSRLVDPVASDKTKLDNYNLEHQSKFDEDVFNVIYSFLNRLKKPVCLIAHNGFRFDFPILRSEIAKLDKELPDEIFCADSLHIFRKLQRPSANSSSVIEDTTKTTVESPLVSTPVNPFQLINEKTPEKKERNELKFTRNTEMKCRKRLTFRLEDVYERVYGQKPVTSHVAEADVIALLLSAIATPIEFLNAIDCDSVPFTSIKKCW
ncbi:three-prime repair exonuclease 1-like [Daphnia carinata]|uniref:three-prime repair exonuclease 1-like n=1 Tax=Daphnia carinata TaxID=120202 RepID=UPI0025802751|nr:three-prime repair exonuclease 1-like [Daphnia carinata]